MGMPQAAHRYTIDEVLAFPSDGNRYELVHGELLVTPAPAQQHQKIVTRLCAGLEAYVAGRHPEAEVFVAPADIFWGPEEYVQPDLCVVPADEVTGDWRNCQTLLLAVEVVSPGSAQADRVKKRRLYQARGVSTYWIVDPDARMVEVWRPDDERPEIVTDVLRWKVGAEAEELAIELEKVFKVPG